MYWDRHDLNYTHSPWAHKIGTLVSNTNTPCCVVITGPEHREKAKMKIHNTKRQKQHTSEVDEWVWQVTGIPHAAKKLHGEWINIKETVQNLHVNTTKVLLTVWLEVQRSLWKQSTRQHLRAFLGLSVDSPPHTGRVSNTGGHLLTPTSHPACV